MDFLQLLNDNIPGFDVAEFNKEWEVDESIDTDEESVSSSSEEESDDEEDEHESDSDTLDETGGVISVDEVLSEFQKCKCPKQHPTWTCLHAIPSDLISKCIQQFHSSAKKYAVLQSVFT